MSNQPHTIYKRTLDENGFCTFELLDMFQGNRQTLTDLEIPDTSAHSAKVAMMAYYANCFLPECVEAIQNGYCHLGGWRATVEGVDSLFTIEPTAYPEP